VSLEPIHTARLILRPFRPADAGPVQQLAGDRDIADTTQNIPHPYEDGMAEAWIDGHSAAWEARDSATFAVVRREDDALAGAVGLRLDRQHNKGELGYWIGKTYWNEGYATEAARALLRLGFDGLGLNRIQASHLARNPASGRVMQKAGMQCEGTARQAMQKWGQYEDLVIYAILRSQWLRSGD